VRIEDDADTLERAIGLACRAHRGQRYPAPEPEPYVLHLLRVMVAVAGPRARMAAVLHDVLEDTTVTRGELRAAGLPAEVVAAVVALTRRPGEDYEPYIERVAEDELARAVKLADLADNLANHHRLEPSPDVDARRDRYERALARLRRSGYGPPVGYAKKNLRDIKDMAGDHGLSDSQEARFPRADLGAEQTGMNFLRVKPGRREAFAHRHREAEEIYVILAGSGQVKLDDELVDLAPLDAVRVSPGVTRSFEAGDEGLEVLIFGPHVDGDGEMVQDFWGE
jgi:mannose-6-phosphate isomerase-like protein (cupin superfamily)